MRGFGHPVHVTGWLDRWAGHEQKRTEVETEKARAVPRRTFTGTDAGGALACAVLAVVLPLPVWIAVFLVAVAVGPGRRCLSRWRRRHNT